MGSRSVFMHYGLHVGIELCKAAAELFVNYLRSGLVSTFVMRVGALVISAY